MPVTLVDRLPLPNLKVYTAGSVLLLSVAVFHALTVTSDPNWRENTTVQRQKVMAAEGDGDVIMMVQPAVAPAFNGTTNSSRNLTEQFVEVMTYMMQEPLCMWTVINIAYCSLAVFGLLVQRAVFGRLRVAEAQRVKDKLWNFVFYKFIFVFGVINVQYMDEVLLWCSWFTAIGFLHLLAQLCKDRFEYLSSSPNACWWAHARLLVLLAGIQAACGALLVVAVSWGLPAGKDTFTFMLAECTLVLTGALHVMARYVLQTYEADAAGPRAYYTHLVFDTTSLVVELVHVVHMVVYSNMLVSMASLVLLMQLRHLLHELQARLRRHRLYTTLATHMSRNYPMASKEEVEKNQDNCAICWEPMKEARKLPCSHLFHNSCLCQWVQQDASCPTCRRALSAGGAASAGPAAGAAGGAGAAGAPGGAGPGGAGAPLRLPEDPAPPHRMPNHLFHFDGSRYVSWLPSFSVEVTRVRSAPLAASQIDAMVRQVQAMFPQYPAGVLASSLAVTRSAALTVDDILDGRLPPPPPPPPPPAVAGPATQFRDAAVATDLPPAYPSAAPSAAPAHTAPRTTAPLAQYMQQDFIEPEPISTQFSGSAQERESTLRRRKEQLLAAARRRYLQKAASRAPDPCHPSAAAPAPATPPAAAAAPSPSPAAPSAPNS